MTAHTRKLSDWRQVSLDRVQAETGLSPAAQSSCSHKAEHWRFVSLTPQMRLCLTPQMRFSLTPQMRFSLTPQMRFSLTPQMRFSLTPQMHRTSGYQQLMSCPFPPRGTWYPARDKRHTCCTWSTHDRTLGTWACVLGGEGWGWGEGVEGVGGEALLCQRLFTGSVTSQHHARVSHRRSCSDNCMCCHTQKGVVVQTTKTQQYSPNIDLE